MKFLLKTTLLAALFLACVAGASAQFSIGVRIGPPPPPRVIRVEPARPGADFIWVDGYWYPVGNHYKWHAGYWSRPPYEGARWVAPHHDGGEYFEGYWDGDHGQMEHDHRWDRDRNRDFQRDDHRDDHHDDRHDDHRDDRGDRH